MSPLPHPILFFHGTFQSPCCYIQTSICWLGGFVWWAKYYVLDKSFIYLFIYLCFQICFLIDNHRKRPNVFFPQNLNFTQGAKGGKWSLEQVNIFRSVCHSVYMGGGGSLPTGRSASRASPTWGLYPGRPTGRGLGRSPPKSEMLTDRKS